MAFSAGQAVRITPVEGFRAGLADGVAYQDTVIEAAWTDDLDQQRITVTFGSPARTRTFIPSRMYDFTVSAL